MIIQFPKGRRPVIGSKAKDNLCDHCGEPLSHRGWYPFCRNERCDGGDLFLRLIKGHIERRMR